MPRFKLKKPILILSTLFLTFGLLSQIYSKENNLLDHLKAEFSWLLQDEKNTIGIVAENSKRVVFVYNIATYRDFFSTRTRQVEQGTGSGFIWDNKGHIVTNFHVIQNNTSVAIKLFDGKVLKGKVLGAEPRKDLAVIKVDPKHLPKVGFSSRIADSSKIMVGQKTVAIGNPFGLDHTTTQGIVSALNRSMDTFGGVTIRDMIQTDASINPGNSGGPLLDSRGYLIGMNTSIYSASGSSAGIGFAVPSNTIKRVVGQLIKHGKVIQLGLGVSIVRSRRLNRYYGIESGIHIESVQRSSEAQKAGLRGITTDRNDRIKSLGDIIIGINDDDIEDYDDLYNTLLKYKAGDKVNVRYLRNEKEKSTKVKLTQINN